MEPSEETFAGEDDSRVLAKPFPKGTVPFGALMCPLGLPKNQ